MCDVFLPADRCAHCILACLFCEVLSACSLLVQLLDCGAGCEVLPCCLGASDAECAACRGDACGDGVDCSGGCLQEVPLGDHSHQTALWDHNLLRTEEQKKV
ncbi:myoD family inhibitor-like [Arapaima gigas]